MDFILTHPQCPNKYLIKSSGNGLSFEIFKSNEARKGTKAKNGKTIKADWSSCGKYPTSFPRALKCAVNLIMMDPDNTGTIEIDLEKEAKKIGKTFKDWIAETEVQLMQ